VLKIGDIGVESFLTSAATSQKLIDLFLHHTGISDPGKVGHDH
jgi:hypothetical protein